MEFTKEHGGLAGPDGSRWIELTKGRFARVDAADFDYLNQFAWCVSSRNFIQRGITRSGAQRKFLMHREIASAPAGTQVDHVNLDRLDNRRSNLRLATNSQNHANTDRQQNNTSGFKGVVWAKQISRWRAKIQVDGRTINLGCFTDRVEAARAYNAAATVHFGAFARLNRLE